MDDIIRIKCPFDGAVLSVKNQPGIESKNVTCPICKHKYPFTQFKRVLPDSGNEDPDTEYPGGDEHTSYEGNGEKTDIKEDLNNSIGMLKVIGLHSSYQMKPGRNIVGRKAQKSVADFQIDTAEKRLISREHIVVEVKKVPSKGFVHYASLYKEKVNDTFIGNERLMFGDCIVLNHGDVIRLPDVTLRFEIPDEEGTEFYMK